MIYTFLKLVLAEAFTLKIIIRMIRAIWGQGVRSITVKREVCGGAGKGQEAPEYFN